MLYSFSLFFFIDAALGKLFRSAAKNIIVSLEKGCLSMAVHF